MKKSNSRQKPPISPDAMQRKKDAINEIRHLMLKCYPDAKTKRTRNQVLARACDIFRVEFGNQKEEIRNQIISRLFNQGGGETLTLDVNGMKAEFKILRYAKLTKLDGIPVGNIEKNDLPQYFKEGVMASLFVKEIERRKVATHSIKRPVIDITPKEKRLFAAGRLASMFPAKWFRKISGIRVAPQY